ncbi:MAG: SDR family oxidoreductase [Burkholderiaceae bacterium]|nr:MAG: SDR family oxidoreductase [Burkholderiaceae bacterium]
MKVIVITGASDGIGAEMARQLASMYGPETALVLAARNAEMLEQVAQQCRQKGARCLVVQTDVSIESECRRLIATAVAEFGQLDVLINNAGKSAQALLSDVEDLSWYEDLMRVNFWGSVWCTHAALPYLRRSRGKILAVSSLAGLVGVPGRNAYSATKFAMNGFFEALRAELRDAGVTVTLAYPGVVATQIRYRGYNAQGVAAGSSGLKEDKAMPVETCAALMIEGMNRGDRDVIMEVRARLGRWLKLLAPKVVENMALAALKKEVRPH